MIFVLIAMSLIYPLLIIAAFFYGQKTACGNVEAVKAETTEKTKAEQPQSVPFDKEADKIAQIMANVEAYDGTKKGQREVI